MELGRALTAQAAEEAVAGRAPGAAAAAVAAAAAAGSEAGRQLLEAEGLALGQLSKVARGEFEFDSRDERLRAPSPAARAPGGWGRAP